jgi:hypothetical protein
MSRVYRRLSHLFDWHWHEECIKVKTFSQQKKRGKTIVYLTVETGHPTTYRLCPGCLAIDARYATKAHPHRHPPLTLPKVVKTRIVIPPYSQPKTTIKTAFSTTAAVGFGQLPGTVRT